jgi:hypothetical protein
MIYVSIKFPENLRHTELTYSGGMKGISLILDVVLEHVIREA